MATQFGQICWMLDGHGWQYTVDREQAVIVLTVEVEAEAISMVIALDEDGELVRLIVPQVWQLVPDHPHEEAVLETLLILDGQNNLVRWQLDPEDGEVRATLELLLEDSDLTQAQLGRAIDTLTTAVVATRSRLQVVAETGHDPDRERMPEMEAIVDLEQQIKQAIGEMPPEMQELMGMLLGKLLGSGAEINSPEDLERWLAENPDLQQRLLATMQAGGFSRDIATDADISQEATEFWIAMLQTVAESQGNSAQVYPWLQQHLNRLNQDLLDALPAVATRLMQGRGEGEKQFIAGTIGNFSNLIQQFPLGNRALNLELAIAGYGIIAQTFTRTQSPELWAQTMNNLATAYSDRIRGDRAENLEQAIACYQQALTVRTQSALPMEWATTMMNLATAYYSRIRGDRAENLEQAIACYQQALTVRTQSALPMEWATTMMNLATAYKNRIRGDSPEERLRHRAENLEQAIACYQQALTVRTQSALPMEWATTMMNLATAYKNRIRGDSPEERLRHRAENLEQAIACYQQALQILTPESAPLDCLKAARGLGEIGFTEGLWQLAIDGFDCAVAAVEQSRHWATTPARKQEILNESIGVYEKLIHACIQTHQYDQALQTVERTRSKRLVDLMATPDAYGDGKVPPEVQTKLHALGQKQDKINQHRLDDLGTANRELSGAGVRSRGAWTAETAEIARLEAEKQQLLDDLSRTDPETASLQAVRPLSPDEMQALLDRPDVAILSFYTTTTDTHIFILRQTGVELFTCAGQGLEQLQQWIIQNWVLPYMGIDPTTKMVQKGVKNQWVQTMPHILAELANRLQIDKLVTQHLTDIRELILIPHLFLHQIPFAALPLASIKNQEGNATSTYLGDAFILRYAPGCQILQLCQKRDALPLGNYGTAENATDDLPCSAFEGEHIAAMFNVPSDRRLRGRQQATVEAYRQLLEQCQSIVSSHHAQTRFDNPLESRLILGDGIITLGQLLSPGWRFRQLSDIFLSCCETGLNLPQTLSDDLLTLGTGFLCAGARSVISTLWAVDDMATALFSIFYHQHREKSDRAISLQKAQYDLRHLTGAEFKTRYYPSLKAHLEQEEERIAVLLTETEDNRDQYAQDSVEYQTLDQQCEALGAIATKITDATTALTQYCQHPFPFRHPVFWAAFVCQGLR